MAVVPAGASHADYLCEGADTDGNGWTEACLVQYDDGGDPECQSDDSFHYGYTGVDVYHFNDAAYLVVFAEGYESCYSEPGYDDEYEEVAAGAYVCQMQSYTCQSVEADWYQYERSSSGDECDTYVYASSDATGSQYVSLEDETGDGCPAGGPPNPGWGNVYP